MKVGFFGNTNNYQLLLAEAMRRRGHEVLFVLHRKESLHRPESRDPQAYGRLPAWMLDASDCSEWDFITLQPATGPVLDQLATCDALVVNDLGPSLLPLLDRPAITFLTGSDLSYYCRLDLPDLRLGGSGSEYRASAAGRAHRRQLEDFVERQRQGLEQSAGVNWALPGLFPEQDQLLASCGVPRERVFNLQMADLDRIAVTEPPDNEVLRVFCGSRLTWKLPVEQGRSPLDYKGTDVLIRGVREFWRSTGRRVELCLVRKGLHVAEAEALAAEEGIADQVVWLDEMPLQDLWQQFQRSDVVAEQLGPGIISMVALDAMACGRPVIGNARPEVPTIWTSPGSPVCQAATPLEVCDWLRRLAGDPALRRRLAREGRAFVEQYFSPARGVDLCMERLAAAPTVVPQARRRLLTTLHEEREEVQRAHGRLEELRARSQEQQQYAAGLLAAMRSRDQGVIWRTLSGPFLVEGERGWRCQLGDLAHHADGDLPRRSRLLLFEDDRLLGPPHSAHDDIRKLGGGCYSHWRSHLYFSTSDGSDPNRNGHRYAIGLVAGNGDRSSEG